MNSPIRTTDKARAAWLTALLMARSGEQWFAWLLVTVLVAMRIVFGGWEPFSPDDGRYLFVGRGVLAGVGPVDEAGALWLPRSPLFGLLLASADAVYRTADFDAAHLVSTVFAVGAVWLIISIGNALGGRSAMWLSVAGLLAFTMWWWLLPTIRIDFAQSFFVLLVIWLLVVPEQPRWLSAGLAVGAAVLIKETALLIVFLPLAWASVVVFREFVAGAVRFLLGFVAIASGWWIYVFLVSGEIYLLTERFGRPATLGKPDTEFVVTTVIAILVVLAAWIRFVVLYALEPRGRTLILTVLAFLPQFLIAYFLGLSNRLYMVGILVSLIVVGVAGGPILSNLRTAASGAWNVRSALRVAAAAFVVAFAVGGIIAGQAAVAPPRPQPTEVAELAEDLNSQYPQGGTVAVSFRHRSLLALHLSGDWNQITLWPPPIDLEEYQWSDYLWIGRRAGVVHGLKRERWRLALELDAVGFVIFWPHVLSPRELTPIMLSDRATDLGLLKGTMYTGARFGVFAERDLGPDANYSLDAVVLHARADAAIDVITEDLRADDFLIQTPVVYGSDVQIEQLRSMLPAMWCLGELSEPYGSGFVQVLPQAECANQSS